MHVFRIFFVTTILIPVLVVAATSDENGLRIRKPRNVVITEDGTRTGRRHNPVNFTDVSCPSLGCTGNLTANSNNGKGSLAASLKEVKAEDENDSILGSNERRLDSSETPSSSFHHHQRPLKLEIKSIKNSTRSDLVNYEDYIVSQGNNLIDEVGTGRGVITAAIIVSWTVYYVFRVIISAIIFNVGYYCWHLMKKKYGIGNDYVETFVKFGKDDKHPFGDYGGGWNPTFGISLKSKVVEEDHHEPWKKGWNGWPGHEHQVPHGWKGWGWPGWPPEPHHNGWGGWDHHDHSPHDASSYQSHHPEYDRHPGWNPKQKTESEEEEDELRLTFDMKKGHKIAQKYAKKYGKKAHKYGLRPSKYSYMFDKDGNIVLGGKAQGYAWHRRKRTVTDLFNVNQKPATYILQRK